MAVRFLPSPEDRPRASREDRTDLAEVVQLRTRLGAQEPQPPTGGSTVPIEPPEPLRPRFGVDAAAVADELRMQADQKRVPAEIGDAQPRSSTGPGSARPLDDDDDDDDDEASAQRAAAVEAGVKILARKARSCGELRAELQRLDHDPNVVELVISEFEENCYLDDAGLARAIAEKLRENKGASRAQIGMKLRERKIDDAVIEAELATLDADEEFELLRAAAQERARKLTGLDQQTAQRRLLGVLARRGWSGEPAMRAARDALAAHEGGGGGVRFR